MDLCFIPQPIFNDVTTLHKQNTLSSSLSYPNFADGDYQSARNFLLAYKNNRETFKTYRREIERFLQWSWLIRKKSIFECKREDLEAFIEFCQKPLKKWIGLNQISRFIIKDGLEQPNPNWRPFVASLPKAIIKNGKKPTKEDFSLSPEAIKIIFATLSSFYNFLINDEKISNNPVALIRQKNKFIRQQVTAAPVRRLSNEQWRYVIKAAQSMVSAEPDKHNRTLFIVQALYGMYLRISELTASQRWIPQMNSFYKDSDGNWWFKVIGKGNKERDISVSDEMLNAFKKYRLSLNLSPLPLVTENTPLIPKYLGTGAITETRYIRKLVQTCFDHAYQLMITENKTSDSEELKVATVHWLRHTGISEDVKIRPREHVRDDAGHSSGAITDRYIDIEKKARARSAKTKKLLT